MSKYPNSGALFKNQRKQKDNHPDYTGKAEVNGKPYYLSAWIKESDKGKWMSLSFKPVEDKVEGRQPDAPEDDDVPF